MTKRLLLTLGFATALVAGSASAAVAGTSGAAPIFHNLVSAAELNAGYTPDQIETAYDLSPLLTKGIDGSRQTIALIELDSFRMSDIEEFDTANKLPAPPLQQYYVGGQAFTLPNAGEATMDLEWAHALAPAASIQVYYVNPKQTVKAGWKSLAQAVTEAAANGATTISMSFGTCTPTAGSGYKKLTTALATVEQKGVSTFVSSGDTGPFPGSPRDCGHELGVSYPASDPSVVAVGGTTLDLNDDDSIANEAAWSLSGGGEGAPLHRPVWQVIAQLANSTYRWAPDVAFDANPRTGVAVYQKGKWQGAGGTSLGAPAWAAIWSLVREDAQQSGKTLGAAAPIIYQIANSPAYSTDFHDVTDGGNQAYQAGPGWDAVTGWGTPDVAQLASTVLTGSTS